MEFVVSMVEAHPFIEGRKEAVKKALERMKGKKLEKIRSEIHRSGRI